MSVASDEDNVRAIVADSMRLPRQMRATIAAALLHSLDEEGDATSHIVSDDAGKKNALPLSAQATEPRGLVTILMATSPLDRHPATDMLERAVGSLGTHGSLSGCRHLIVCDGYPHDDAKTAKRYATYKGRLRRLSASRAFPTNVELLELGQTVGLPGVVLAGCRHIRTPYVLMFDHDWEMVRQIDVAGILEAFEQRADVHCIRLNKRRNTEAGWDYVIKPDYQHAGVPLVRTICWSGTPHFARLSFYRRMVLPRLQERPQGGAQGFEEPIDDAYQADTRTLGFDRAQRKWGVFVYGSCGAPRVVHHLDGRRRGTRLC